MRIKESVEITPTGREEGSIFQIGSVAGILGSLLAMVGNLLHPATPIGDPEGVARAIAQSETWVLVHLVIVVGLILMLGGLVAISHSIEGGGPGALAQLGSVAAVAGVTVGVVLVIVDGVAANTSPTRGRRHPPRKQQPPCGWSWPRRPSTSPWLLCSTSSLPASPSSSLGSRWPGAVSTLDGWGGWLWSPASARCRSAWYRPTQENPSALPG